LTQAAASTFVQHQRELLAGTLEGDLVEHMRDPAKSCILAAKQLARERIFQDKRKTLHEIGAYSTLETLLNAFCGAVVQFHSGQALSFKNRRIFDLLGNSAPQPDQDIYQSFLRVIDYI